MPGYRSKLKSGAIAGAKKGWSSYFWMVKIIIPVSFLMTLLQWTGWLSRLDFLLNPLMSLINLPPEAALPVITGMLTNLYAVIAIITVIPFTVEQMTLIAIFNLIAHGLIMEGIIQHKSGLNAITATLIRIATAITTVIIVSQFLGDTSQSVVVPATLPIRTPLLGVLKVWGLDTVRLLIKILGIIMAIMVLLELLKSLGWMEYLLRFSRPLMRILGLSEQTVMMWVAAILFGLLYSGALIAEEAKKGGLTKDALERLHIFIGSNHAMIEDPALFAVLGINILWLLVPRFIMATVMVQAYGFVERVKTKLRRRGSPAPSAP